MYVAPRRCEVGDLEVAPRHTEMIILHVFTEQRHAQPRTQHGDGVQPLSCVVEVQLWGEVENISAELRRCLLSPAYEFVQLRNYVARCETVDLHV